ncbi:hypothetical protein BS78_04G241600 [Paspalum vaginatum]|nr:hypothetical protein BS78_04G241600 [Paspalum vaginatum]
MDELAALARGEGWTEERHAAFLDRMELSFVRQVLGRQPATRGPAPPQPQAQAEGGRGQPVPAPALPLDRPLPDSAVESNRPPAARRRAAVHHAAAGSSRNS